MKSIEIKGINRKSIGKKASREVRKEEQIPCNLYGGKENVHFQVHELDLHDLLYTPEIYIINLDIEGKQYKAILHDVQFHPVTDHAIHAEFLEVSDDKKITTAIPVKIVGDSIGIKQGGKLHQKKRKLKIKAFIKDIPDHIEVNISDLGIGKSIKIQDMKVENIEFLDPANDVICAVKVTRASKTTEEGAAAEGEAAPAAEAAAANA